MAEPAFPLLDQLVGAYFGQDMDLWAASAPEAIAQFAGEADAASREGLKAELDRFLERYGDGAGTEFVRRYGAEFMPEDIGQTVPEFAAMTKAIMDDPADWKRFDRAEENGG